MGALAGIDLFVIAGYFILVFAIAIWSSISKRSQDSSKNYFLGGKNVGWFVIGASLFASNIGSEHLVGLAGDGASTGIAVAQFEILAAFMLLALGWIFVPFYIKSGVFTMPEFLEKRYSPAARYYLSGVSIIAYIMTKVSVTILAGAIVFEVFLGLDFWVGAVLIVLLTGIYTVIGGLRAVVYTDTIQMFVLLGGAIALTIFGLNELGGWGEMTRIAGPDMMTLWKPTDDPDYPWTGIIFGAPILGIWYWCTDQFIVQRVLSAKDVSNARKATIFAGFLKMLPLFIFVIPGVIAYCMVQKGMITLNNTDQALATLVTELLPVGLKGLIAAGLLAALMSSLSSVFNSSSTLFTMDIYKKFVKDESDKHYVFIGQIATVVIVILGLAWIPLLQKVGDSGLFKSLQAIQAYIAPPIAAVFLLGLFIKRLNGTGAMSALATGAILGVTRLALEIIEPENAPFTGMVGEFVHLNFLYFAAILFVLCAVILVVVSIITAEPTREKLALIFDEYRSGEDVAQGQSTEANAKETDKGSKVSTTDVILTILLLATVAAIWIYFS